MQFVKRVQSIFAEIRIYFIIMSPKLPQIDLAYAVHARQLNISHKVIINSSHEWPGHEARELPVTRRLNRIVNLLNCGKFVYCFVQVYDQYIALIIVG